MAKVSKTVLKSYFQPGDKPTASQFGTLIDSMLNYTDDREFLGLKNYDPTLIYITGDTVVYNTSIYQAINETTGTFVPLDWNKIAGFIPGTVIYKGTWNAQTNTPDLNTIAKAAGDYYVVSVQGTTGLNPPPNTISSWNVGDWAIYDGTLWGRVNNTEGVTDAINLPGPGVGIYKTKNDTVLQFKNLTNTDGSVLLTSTTNSVDVGIQFDDAGVSASRTWSAFQINSELTTKEPANPNIQAHIADTTTNPHNVTKVQVGLGNVQNTKMNFAGISDPTSGDDGTQGYSIGSTWINAVAETEFTCMDSSTGAAVWQKITANPNIQVHIADMNNPHNTTKAQVGLGNVENLKVNLTATSDPVAANDNTQGYAIGSRWINTVNGKEYVCVNAATGAAAWKETTSSSSSVFGNNYLVVESLVESGSDSYVTPFPFFKKVALSTGTRSGTYRIQWSCVVHHEQAAGQGKFQLINTNAPQTVIGIPLVFEQKDLIERVPLGGIATVVLAGVNQTFEIQYQTLKNGKFQYIDQARIELFQVS